MRITRGYKSEQVEDRRGESTPGGGGLGGGGANLLIALFRRFGIPGVVVGAAFLYFAGGLGSPANTGTSTSGNLPAGSNGAENSAEQPLVELVSFVLDDAQNTWRAIFARENKPYTLATLVLFRDRTRSACGMGQAEMGPFYCSNDQKVYIDLGFYQELRQRFGAPGDFAQAYVIAHELGHHVQNLLGRTQLVHDAPESSQNGPRGLSVRLELQADCYAGIWGNGTKRRDILENGDLEEALKAATAIGDDALQRQTTGTVRPESFTHGTSAQRKLWFKRGFDTGDPGMCDTFKASAL
jgi:predicted metalloprotease